MKKVDQRVTTIDAKAYDHSMITEHSLSPPDPNNWAIVPASARGEYKYNNLKTIQISGISEYITYIHSWWKCILK